MRSRLQARMKLTAPRTFARSVIVAITILSWLAISNHCVFGGIADRERETQSACPFHSEPVKPQPPPSGIQCCKILRAVVPAVTKSWARDDAKFSSVDLRVDEFALVAHLHTTPAPLFLDTGPPEARTFAELTLHRSLLAHAPPRSA
jgi:hypothetical protein